MGSSNFKSNMELHLPKQPSMSSILESTYKAISKNYKDIVHLYEDLKQIDDSKIEDLEREKIQNDINWRRIYNVLVQIKTIKNTVKSEPLPKTYISASKIDFRQERFDESTETKLFYTKNILNIDALLNQKDSAVIISGSECLGDLPKSGTFSLVKKKK